MSKFVKAYSSVTGRRLPDVPEHWMDHPVLGKNIRRSPKSAAEQKRVKATAEKASDQVESDT